MNEFISSAIGGGLGIVVGCLIIVTFYSWIDRRRDDGV